MKAGLKALTIIVSDEKIKQWPATDSVNNSCKITRNSSPEPTIKNPEILNSQYLGFQKCV